MRRRYGSGDRGPRDRKPKTSKRKLKEEKHFVRHPLFGEIPIITMESTSRLEYWDYDPDYKPKLPPGAVRGDVQSQHFCRMCHVPRYFYVNEDKTCVQCGQDFVFSAKEQKYWYESLGFHFDATAVRCPKCRRIRRTIKALNNQLALTKRKLRQKPNDPSLLLSLARSIVAFHQRTKSGNLDEAISACRRAIKLWPEAFEAVYWEGMCHLAAGRKNKADALFTSFIKMVGGRGKYRSLRRKAELQLTAGQDQ